jgi:transglutaminase-like putative cysteine protease
VEATRGDGALDHRSIDWARVGRAVYRVRHHYRYSYAAPVRDLRQQLVMVPPDRHEDQHLVDHRLDVRGTSGACELGWASDAFGNRISFVQAERVDHAVDFEAVYRVERRAAEAKRRALDDWAAYLEPTALTAPDPRLEAAARAIAGEQADPRARAERANEWAADSIDYQLGVTGVQTPAAMALHFGRGVCQDYAHILLGLLRLLGIPARYVSGHLLGEGAPHAWVEALLGEPGAPDGEVVAYDPTHRRRVGLTYVTVAVGRDFADVTPTSGVVRGPAAGKLSWNKQAELLEVAYDHDGETTEAA